MSDDDLWRPTDGSSEGAAPAGDPAGGAADQPVPDETRPLYGAAGPSPIPPPTNPYGDHNPYAPPPNPYQPPHEFAQPQSPYGSTYQPAYAGGALPEHPSATTAMVLGIVSLAGLLFTVGLTLLLAPVAWVVGARAVREIDASPGRYSGRDRAQAGKVMGIIGTVLLALGVLAVIAIVALAVAVASSDPSPAIPSPQVHSGVVG
jgi:Domain of unknown function (DUF4190)